MRFAPAAIIATTFTAACLAGTTWASATVDAPAPVVTVYGDPHAADRYFAVQTIPDCVEQAARMAIDIERGKAVVTPAAIDAYARSYGVLHPGGGSNFDLSTDAVINHYGVHADGPYPMSRARLQRDLAAGVAVVVTLNANTIWNPQGYASNTPGFEPDHAVLVESVDSNDWVTLADTGGAWSEHEVVPWSTFSRAWSAGGYSAIVVTR